MLASQHLTEMGERKGREWVVFYVCSDGIFQSVYVQYFVALNVLFVSSVRKLVLLCVEFGVMCCVCVCKIVSSKLMLSRHLCRWCPFQANC